MAETFSTGGYDAPLVYKDKAVSNTVLLVYASANNLLGWRITNPNSTTTYFKFFNSLAVTDVTLGTTEPVKEFSIPALGEIYIYNQRGISHFYFSKGMCIVSVNGLATSSTTAPILSLDVEIYYAK